MTAVIDTPEEQIVELDERESEGIRVTLIWNRATNSVSVLVWDERANEFFAVEVAEGEDVYDVFNHPFAYAAFRGLRESMPEVTEYATTSA